MSGMVKGFGFAALGPLLPYIAAGLLAALGLAGWYINDRAYDRATARCNAAHAQAALKATAEAVRLAQERDKAISRADTADALAKRTIDKLAARGRDTVKEYYRANPADNRPCLPADRLRSIADSDRAALAAAETASAGGAAVPDPAAGGRR